MIEHRRRLLMQVGPSLPLKDTLENTSWADIAHVAAAGKAPSYWAVGDSKTITFPSALFGSSAITVKIVGFNYDDLADGSGKAAISFGMAGVFSQTQRINSTATNVGGWENCAFRATLSNIAFPALESAIGSGIIKTVSKRTSEGNKSTNITTTSENVWLFSEFEVYGAVKYSALGEKPPDISTCYPVFTNASSRIKRNSAGSAVVWWTRSPYVGTYAQFCDITTSGGQSTPYAHTPEYISIGFCV